jgi:hypothetical protein
VIQATQNSDTHTNVIGNTENRATAQMIKAQIEAVIPDFTNSVIAALSAHGLLDILTYCDVSLECLHS